MADFKDDKTTVQEMKDLIFQFAKDRAWIHYHTPKNLSMALTVEAGELMEHFMWLDNKEIEDIKSTETINDVKDELADIVTYALEIANVMEIDLAEAILNKYKKNCLKYPEAECKKVFKKR